MITSLILSIKNLKNHMLTKSPKACTIRVILMIPTKNIPYNTLEWNKNLFINTIQMLIEVDSPHPISKHTT